MDEAKRDVKKLQQVWKHNHHYLAKRAIEKKLICRLAHMLYHRLKAEYSSYKIKLYKGQCEISPRWIIIICLSIETAIQIECVTPMRVSKRDNMRPNFAFYVSAPRKHQMDKVIHFVHQYIGYIAKVLFDIDDISKFDNCKPIVFFGKLDPIASEEFQA